MHIIGIDPGNVQSAVAIIPAEGPIKIQAQIYENHIMQRILSRLPSKNNIIAIEMIASYGMAVGKTVFDTCVWIGRFIQTLEDISIYPVLIYRKEIVTYICGSARAKDSNIRQALIDIYGPPGKKKDPGGTYGIKKDMWAALAVAHYFKNRPSPNEEEIDVFG